MGNEEDTKDEEKNVEKELIRSRGTVKTRLTNFSKFLESLDSNSLSTAEVTELQLRLEKSLLLLDQFEDIQSQLETVSDNLESLNDERVEFENRYYKLISSAKEIISSYENRNNDSGSDGSSAHTVKSCRQKRSVRMPPIQLPKFSGSYENWLEFRDTFTSLIHKNPDYDEISKFHYLRASLEGTAAEVIKKVDFCASNYCIAWKLLLDRFDNVRLLTQNHVAALFNLKPISKETSSSLKNMIDQFNKNLRALLALGEPTTNWDTLLIYLATQKLDPITFQKWEEHKSQLDRKTAITLDIFMTFIRQRADFLETLELSQVKSLATQSHKTQSQSQSRPKVFVALQNNTPLNNSSSSMVKSCPNCDSIQHSLCTCPSFLALSVEERIKKLPNFKICYCCLQSSSHYANRCNKNKTGCKRCRRRHHILICTEPIENASENQGRTSSSPAQPAAARTPPHSSNEQNNITLSANISMSDFVHNEGLLATALVKLYDANNCEHIARVALDSASTSCILSERMYNLLNLPYTPINKTVIGINNVVSQINKMCLVPMHSVNGNYSAKMLCFVLPTLTDDVPSCPMNISGINLPTDICLADPKFFTPAPIDLLIGAQYFWDIAFAQAQQISLGQGNPILRETHLGWIAVSPTPTGAGTSDFSIKCNFTKVDDIQNQLTRFWQLEEVSPKSSNYSSEEKMCEQHFVKNTTRLDDGSFCVKIPLKEDPLVLGDSSQRAKRCFNSTERRLTGTFGQLYRDFMAEYERLGHMTELTQQDIDLIAYFIPHLGVLRESSITTLLRVVFNCSARTTSGISLNDIQMVGPTVQDDLLSILLRFRFYKYVLSADVEKMYRTVVVHPSDRHLQQIYWRPDPSETVKIFQLNTVTYGMASAPFLATRCLKQLGLDCIDKDISEIIIHDFYVDDLLTGCDDLEHAKSIRDRLTTELASARMNLRKWKSNEEQLVSESTQPSLNLNIGSNEPSKVLGLGWVTNSDELCFPIGSNISNKYTKRDMLSVISQIFDPLGLLSPCVIRLKILLQRLWLLKLSWDDQLPTEIIQEWCDVISNLPNLNDLRIPRIVVCDSYSNLEFHIFTDSSERAYGACLYVLSSNDNGDIAVRLLMAKSRVAPLKPVTLPRLELCAALCGARLYDKAINSLRIPVNRTTFWSDSTIVLGWLKMLPSRLQTFVRNRVGEIVETTADCQWRHVPTQDNPADLVSRGVPINSIQTQSLYWSGPDFLHQGEASWPPNIVAETTLPEVRNEVVSLLTKTEPPTQTLIDFDRFSNLSRLKRAVAYMLRFIDGCKKQPHASPFLTESELRKALNLIIITSQRESFPEYALLEQKQSLPKKSPFLKFNPFLDEDGIMRVYGRLTNSDFPFEKKHPILIQSTHKFTKLLFHNEHKRLLHAGPQLLLYTIRETYWPIGGRNLAKACFHQCVKCTRIKGKITAPLMGNLPKERLAPGVFESVGCDYAGPMTCASRQGRGCRMVRVYIAIFICFSTKAIHLELVGDLTSQSFLLALHRFTNRRGKPSDIYSDNGTNFVGASNELSRFLKTSCNSLSEQVANEGINFHFIPAYSPHFGGLWEAGVKSTKYHLQRVLGNCNLTYEEFNTTLVQIEGILNSRPLTPLSSNPEDLTPLTPGHFLIGRPITALPTKDLQDRSFNHLTRFQRVEQLRQHFWKRWSAEYISELQLRTKWRTSNEPLKLNTLVLLKEENLPPLKWKMGRIVALVPGSDGISRVADVKTSTGIVRRSFAKICPLPVAADETAAGCSG